MSRKISVTNSHHEKLVGILEDTGSSVLFICCHGYGGTKEDHMIKGFADNANTEGFSTYRFDFNGVGESDGSPNLNLKNQVNDVKSVVSFFQNRYPVIYLATGSFSALVGAIAVTKIKDITGLITINGFFGMNKLGWGLLYFYYYYQLMALYNVEYKQSFDYFEKNFQPEKIRIPTLVVHGESDTLVHIDQSHHFYSRLKTQKQFVAIAGVDHMFTKPGSIKRVSDQVIKWVEEVSIISTLPSGSEMRSSYMGHMPG